MKSLIADETRVTERVLAMIEDDGIDNRLFQANSTGSSRLRVALRNTRNIFHLIQIIDHRRQPLHLFHRVTNDLMAFPIRFLAITAAIIHRFTIRTPVGRMSLSTALRVASNVTS